MMTNEPHRARGLTVALAVLSMILLPATANAYFVPSVVQETLQQLPLPSETCTPAAAGERCVDSDPTDNCDGETCAPDPPCDGDCPTPPPPPTSEEVVEEAEERSETEPPGPPCARDCLDQSEHFVDAVELADPEDRDVPCEDGCEVDPCHGESCSCSSEVIAALVTNPTQLARASDGVEGPCGASTGPCPTVNSPLAPLVADTAAPLLALVDDRTGVTEAVLDCIVECPPEDWDTGYLDGDCECLTFVPTPDDLDGDGAYNDDDIDDDCDKLSDGLELAVGFVHPSVPDDTSAITAEGVPVSIRLAITGITYGPTDLGEVGENPQCEGGISDEVVDCDPEGGYGDTNWPDPYLNVTYTTRSHLVTDGYLNFPELNAANHVWNTAEGELWPGGEDAWSTNLVEFQVPSADFGDFANWGLREGLAIPAVLIRITAWEDDPEGSDRGPDDLIGQFDQEQPLTDYALGLVNGLPDPEYPTVWDVGGMRLDVQVGSNVNPCALQWASILATQNRVVQEGDMTEVDIDSCQQA